MDKNYRVLNPIPYSTGKPASFLAWCFLLISVSCIPDKHPIPKPKEPERPSGEVIRQWQQQKFSMFIHFGLYSIPGGIWDGKKITKGYSEQIRAHANIPRSDYRKLAAQFNPINWNPDSIAVLAKRSGMKSIIITAKHHDGFALFKSRYSDFNIVDATPFKRDLIKELSEACARQQINFGLYYSLIDWDYEGAMPISEHNSDSIPPAHQRLNLDQVEELMSHYGKISEIWFDMGKPTPFQSKELANLVRRLQPGCLISGRIWNDQGDFAVMGDNVTPDFKLGVPWQTPASMFNETWGYRIWQQRGSPEQKAVEKLKAMISVNANGGNYLLNIGPSGDGSVLPFERSVLITMGKWIDDHKDILIGLPVDGPDQKWGVILKNGNGLNLFILNESSKTILVKGLKTIPKRVYETDRPETELEFNSVTGGIEISLGKSTTKKNLFKIIRMEFADHPEIKHPATIESSDRNGFELSIKNAIKYHSFSGKDYYSTKSVVVKLEWRIEMSTDQEFEASLLTTEHSVSETFLLNVNFTPIIINYSKSGGQKDQKTNRVQLRRGINIISLESASPENPHRDPGFSKFKIDLK